MIWRILSKMFGTAVSALIIYAVHYADVAPRWLTAALWVCIGGEVITSAMTIKHYTDWLK